jgi:hypothetical protein
MSKNNQLSTMNYQLSVGIFPYPPSLVMLQGNTISKLPTNPALGGHPGCTRTVAQVSKPAVSPISKSAGRATSCVAQV